MRRVHASGSCDLALTLHTLRRALPLLSATLPCGMQLPSEHCSKRRRERSQRLPLRLLLRQLPHRP